MWDLPAGRELDARVAEVLRLPEAPFSTDLAASWQVAEHLVQQGYRVDSHFTDEGRAVITIASPVDEPRLFEAETPAHALCHAALAVCKV